MEKNKKTNIMTTLLMLLFLLAFLIISGRFIYIQTTGEANNVSLLDWAADKRSASIQLKAERGKIYDHNSMILAYNRPTYRVYAILDENYSMNQPEPKHVVDTKETAAALSPLIDMTEEEVKGILDKGIKDERFQVEFGVDGKNLSREKMLEIKELDLPGINFLEDSIRYYPNGMFASHIIGFARNDEDGDEIIGVTGIEKEKNTLLSGTDGFLRYNRDKYNKKLLNAEEVVREPENGTEIYLTLDQKIQTLLEDVLSQVDDKYEPARITAVVMNAKTGEILALGNRPSYNPNDPDEIENWYNDVISTPVEPGSTLKIFTWAAAINSGSYNGTEYYQSGRYKINERVAAVNDHNQGKGWGMIDYNEGFRRSSNVAASKLVWEKMGPDTFYDYLQAFDFDKETGIDLPSEVTGKISYNYPSDKLRTAFGQSTTVTPIQQMKAATAIVNGGKMLRPYVIEKIVDGNTNEVLEENGPKVVGEPITEDTANQMVDLLASVVDSEDGTGQKYQLDDYSVIGKTGTAQISKSHGKGYLTGRQNNIFSFLGMAPKDDPEIIMHVSVTQPNLSLTESGSDPVAFIFKNVMSNGLHYLNINPDKEKTIKHMDTFTFPDVINKQTKDIDKIFKDSIVEPIFVGNGKNIVQSNIRTKQEILENQRVILVTDKPLMPDIKGWSQRDVMSLGTLFNMDVQVEGSGYVTKQSIKKDSKLKDGMVLKVELSSPLKEEEEKDKEETSQ